MKTEGNSPDRMIGSSKTLLEEVATQERVYVEKHIIDLYKLWLKRLIGLTIILFTLFSLVDLYISKDLLYYLFPYRLAISSLMFTILISNNFIKTKKHLLIHLFCGATLTAVSIQVLSLLSFSYHDYLYYSGYYLVIIGLLGFLPLGRWSALFTITIVYMIFIIPILIIHPNSIYNKSFFMINVYLASCNIMCYVLRLVLQGNLEDSLKMRFRIEKEKESLKEYSFLLKGQVQSKEYEIEQSGSMLRGIIENTQDGVLVSDTSGIIQMSNTSACKIFGGTRETIIGSAISKMLKEASWDDRIKLILKKGRSQVENTIINAVGNKTYVEINANLLDINGVKFIVYLCRDVTDKRKLEQQLLLSQKMESIGTLAGGMAHDFKNVLATIMGFVDYIRHTKPEGEMCTAYGNILESVEIVENEVKKASDVVTQLLSVGKRSNAEFDVIDINELIENIVSLYSKVMKNIEFKMRLQRDCYYIYGNSGLLEQAISNIIINSHEAIAGWGRIYISSELKYDRNSVSAAGIIPRTLQIIIEDTGSGIPDKIIPLIFDPFFTTKVENEKKGTGLGLAMVYGIVKEHGGDIVVDSKVGKGTLFTIDLPINNDKLRKYMKDIEISKTKLTTLPEA